MEDNYDISNLKQKKKINSRTKGSGFERQICKMFNKRFNTSEFCRSPGSGAFATTHSLPEHLKIYGDLITPEKFKALNNITAFFLLMLTIRFSLPLSFDEGQLLRTNSFALRLLN